MQENVIVAIFNVPSEAYQAFSELKAHTQTVDSLIAQAVLVKKENGLLISPPTARRARGRAA